MIISAFLSYAPQDRAIAEAVASALSAAGVQVAAPESAVALGDDFAAAIEQRIIEADRVIVLWSIAAAQSEWTAREVEFAIKAWARDRLVLVRADSAELPPGLRDISAIDLASDRQRGIGEIVRQVRSGFGIAAAGLAESPPAFAAPMARSPAPQAAPRSRRWLLLAGIIYFLSAVAAVILAYVYIGFREEAPQVRAPAPTAPAPVSPMPLPTPMPAPPPSPGEPHSPGSAILVIVAVGGTLSGALAVWVAIGIAKRRGRRTAVSAPAVSPPPSAAPLPPSAGPSAPHEVFVSYSRRDETLVDRLVVEIENAGLRVWIDRQAEAQRMRRYAAPIVAAIRSSRLVALMCSHHAFASDHVVREVYVAGDFRKPFIVFQLDQAEIPDELLYFLSGFPRVPAEPVDPGLIRSEIARFLA